MTQKLVCLLSQDEIAAMVKRLARDLDRDYDGLSPILAGVLKGSFVFLADLARQMRTPLQSVEFLRVSSYGRSTESSGRPRIVLGLPREVVRGRHIIVVEDIVDTGLTTDAVLRYLRRRGPASLKLCALLDKPSRRKVAVTVDYLGATVPDRFVVGYGIDAREQYRQLPEIYALGGLTWT